MPSAASVIALTRVRDAPWNETIPAGCAPSAANTPYSRCPVARPTTSGVTIPNPARSARGTSTADQRNGPKFSQPPWLSSAASIRRLDRNQAPTADRGFRESRTQLTLAWPGPDTPWRHPARSAKLTPMRTTSLQWWRPL